MLLLGIWLIATGLLQVLSIQIPGVGTVLAALGTAAGVLILLGRQAVRFASVRGGRSRQWDQYR